MFEPAARLLRDFFDPRIAQLDHGLREDLHRELSRVSAGVNEKLAAGSRAIAAESEIAGIRDEALRDGLTMTNTRIGRIEADLAVIRRRIDKLVDEDRNRDLS